MSSIIVYGESAPYGKTKVITKDTKPSPANFYGDSKLQADIGLQKLSDDKFKVCILRPPMIYGPGSKGNYPLLSKIAKKMPIFPDIKNERSMLYIGNLCFFIRLCINERKVGIFFPQNAEYVSTSQLVKEIAKVNGKNIRLTKVLNPLVLLASHIPGKFKQLCNKAFGSIFYEKSNTISQYSFQESIKKTEVSK